MDALLNPFSGKLMKAISSAIVILAGAVVFHSLPTSGRHDEVPLSIGTVLLIAGAVGWLTNLKNEK